MRECVRMFWVKNESEQTALVSHRRRRRLRGGRCRRHHIVIIIGMVV